MHAAHAQVMSAAELSVGLRLAGSTRATVRDALADGIPSPRRSGRAAPCTWCRPATCDVDGRAGGRPAGRSPFAADVRLSARTQTRRSSPPWPTPSTAGELTLDELDEAVVARTGAVGGRPGDARVPGRSGRAGARRSGRAAQAGCWCSGPTAAARSPTPARAARRPGLRAGSLPPRRIPAFLRGYLHAYGPATPAHLARWMGASLDWASRAFEAGRGGARPGRRHAGLGERWGHRSARAGSERAPAALLRRAGRRASSPARTCSPDEPGTVPWRAGRPATTRCFSSTASCGVSGTRSAPGAGCT